MCPAVCTECTVLRPVHGRLLVEQKAQMWRSSEREGAPEFTIYYFTNVYGGLPDGVSTLEELTEE